MEDRILLQPVSMTLWGGMNLEGRLDNGRCRVMISFKASKRCDLGQRSRASSWVAREMPYDKPSTSEGSSYEVTWRSWNTRTGNGM